MNGVIVDHALIDGIAARLDLRQPNKEALESIAYEVAQHYDVDKKPPPLEGVVDVATGVGKTYVLAASLEYFAATGTTNFAVVTPGRTILEKTVANFTPGHPKSLLGGMETSPVVITSENFATPTMRAAMDDHEQTKLYIFTVQALLKPTTEVGRRTHKFQEGLGEAFYSHLAGLDDLVVFADEHHTYYGTAFSKAVHELNPRVLIGLTATPHKKTPKEQIWYRYPLAAAIADRLVKIPVLVGRKDDRTDAFTKLHDGIRLLELKRKAVEAYSATTGKKPVNPVMLVIAQSIDDAEEYGRIIRSPDFAGSAYADRVLVIHSDAPDKALAELEGVEDEASPVRIIISVGMLKEGWDVKNVYVIASMRSSVSEVLTEQTLGRGLRLPFGIHTDIEILDTLEVLAHERYEDLLRKAGVINEAFIDYRTRIVLRRNAAGDLTAVPETAEVRAPVTADDTTAPQAAYDTGALILKSTDSRNAQVEEESLSLQVRLAPRGDLPLLEVPRLTMRSVKNPFSLADITELDSFRQLGEHLAADPLTELRRTVLSARIIEGTDGIRRTELVSSPGVDRIESPAKLLEVDESVRQLTDLVLSSPVVPARKDQRRAVEPIIAAFLTGLGGKAQEILSGYLDRAAARLIALITDEQRKFATKPSYDEVTELVPFQQVRTSRPIKSHDRMGAFVRGAGYEGWARSMYPEAWFDSSPERDVANILDDSDEIAFWVRLHKDDLPILWGGAGKWYNPDFIAVDTSNTHWIVEVKMDKEMKSPDVQDKKEAAQRWANHVSADERMKVQWRYLLVSETDVQTARGSWPALRGLAGM